MKNEDTKLKNAIDFLLFSYFGITLESKQDEILPAVIDRAYRDASSHVLSIVENEKENIKNNAKDLLIEQLEKLPDENGYDNWHNDLCNDLISVYDTESKEIYKTDKNGKTREFTYGIAQKWVNMSMKYLYLLHSIYSKFADENDYCINIGESVSKIADTLHVPVDSYIIEAAWDIKDVNLPLKDNKKRDKTYSNPSEQVEPWSKWENNKNENDKYITKGTYTDFQVSLRNSLYEKPIDWEGSAWIDKAKKRKEPKNKPQKNS